MKLSIYLSKQFLSAQGIKFRVVRTTLKAKAAYIESFNRTMQNRITRYLNWKKLTHQQHQKRYVEDIQAIVNDYNNTRHSSLKFWAPSEVDKNNATQVYHQLRTERERVAVKQPHLSEFDYVRLIELNRGSFDKGSQRLRWSKEIFKINRVILRRPYPVYELIDKKKRIIKGKFYERELQKIDFPYDTPVEILQRPSVFDKNTKWKMKTKSGQTRMIDMKKELNQRKYNNYNDMISMYNSF